MTPREPVLYPGVQGTGEGLPRTELRTGLMFSKYHFN